MSLIVICIHLRLILTNYVAATGDTCPLRAAMGVSVAWDVLESNKSLEAPLNIAFNKYLAEGLVRTYEK